MKYVVSVAFAAALASGVGSAAAEELNLEPEVLTGLFPGHYEARVAGGYRLLIAAKEDGTMMGRAFGKQDKGKWKVEDDKLCVAWKSWTRGKYRCGTIVQNGEWFVATSDKGDKTMKFRPVDKREVMSARVGRRVGSDR